MKSRPPFCSPFSSLPSQVGWETVGAGGGDEGRAGRFAGPSLFAGFGCEVRKGEKPPPPSGSSAPPPKISIEGGGGGWGCSHRNLRAGKGKINPKTAKKSGEHREEMMGWVVWVFFWGGGAAQERRSDPRKEKRRGCDPPPPLPPPRTPEGWTALIYNPLLSLLSKDPGFPGRELNCELWIWVFFLYSFGFLFYRSGG